MKTSTFTILRDGQVIVSGLATEHAVTRWFHQHTPFSENWACRWEGYSVAVVAEDADAEDSHQDALLEAVMHGWQFSLHELGVQA